MVKKGPARKPKPVSEKKGNRKSHSTGGRPNKSTGSSESGDGKKHRRPPPSSKYRWGPDGKPKVDVAKEKKKKGKTVSIVAAKRSKYLEKLDSYSGKKSTTIKGVSGMRKDETQEAYLARTKEAQKKTLKEVNTSSLKLKNKEKWKQYNEKKEKKEIKRKAARKARADDSDSELDEERTILDGPRKHRKVEFERPEFGDFVQEPPRDLKDIAAKMLSKQSLTRYAEKVTGEKFDKTIKKVVMPDVELEAGEDDEDEQTRLYQQQLEQQRKEAEDAELSPEALEKRKKKEEARQRKLERLAILKEEIATREKAEAAAREKRTLYAKFSIADLMAETRKRAEKAIKRKAKRAGEAEQDEEDME